MGLNRTMQYGNSTLLFLLQCSSQSLNRTMQYGNPIRKNLYTNTSSRFKSYYVVWKLDFSEYFVHNSLCLNRTMQYGNLLLLALPLYTDFGLNRTMQYGNRVTRAGGDLRVFSLNRTMQYGNNTLLISSAVLQQFKSYYVVWKLFSPVKTYSSTFGLNRTMQYGNLFC